MPSRPAHGVGDRFETWSPPSTSTVNRAVIGPASVPSAGLPRPGALQQLGQFGEDGSWSSAVRPPPDDLALGHGAVTLSIRHSTSSPWSRKNPATAMVMYAAWRRFSAGSSLVATTTTARFRPSRRDLFDELDPRPRFADQADHHDITGRLTRQHAWQHRLCHARNRAKMTPPQRWWW